MFQTNVSFGILEIIEVWTMKIKLKTDHEKKYFRTGTVNFIKYCPVKCDRCEFEKKTDSCFYLFLKKKTLFATELLKKMRF